MNGVASLLPAVEMVHTTPAFSTTSLRPSGRNTSCTGNVNVADGMPFSTTKPAGGTCARAVVANDASMAHTRATTPQRPRATMGSFPGDQTGWRSGARELTNRWVRVAGGFGFPYGWENREAFCDVAGLSRPVAAAVKRFRACVPSRPLLAQAVVSAATHRQLPAIAQD